jgi:signal transduction histidine kinase
MRYGLGQELTGLSPLLSAFVNSTRHGKSLEVTDLERALDVAQHGLQSCRSIAHGLSPVTETQGGLIAGLREIIARLETWSGPTLDFTTIGATRLGLRSKFHITRLDHAGTCVVCECPQTA